MNGKAFPFLQAGEHKVTAWLTNTLSTLMR